MRHEKNRDARFLELPDLVEAFRLEARVTHGKGFVDDQDRGVDVNGHGKREPHIHAARIGFDRLIDEIADFRELLDAGEFSFDLVRRHSQHGGVQIDVLPTGKLQVETGSQFEQCGHAAVDRDIARGGSQCSANDLQKCGLAGAVAPDDADRLATSHRKRYIPKRPEFPGIPGAFGEDDMLETVERRVVYVEALRGMCYLNRGFRFADFIQFHEHRHLQNVRESFACLLEPGQTDPRETDAA
jgi:hypothetical protein